LHISLLQRSGLGQFRELAGSEHPSHMHVVRHGYGGLTGEAAPRQINTGYSVNGSFAEYAPTDPAYVGHLLPSRHNAAPPLRDRKFADSSVEGNGFELSVPHETDSGFEASSGLGPIGLSAAESSGQSSASAKPKERFRRLEEPTRRRMKAPALSAGHRGTGSSNPCPPAGSPLRTRFGRRRYADEIGALRRGTLCMWTNAGPSSPPRCGAGHLMRTTLDPVRLVLPTL
jgi:hypothetical protein